MAPPKAAPSPDTDTSDDAAERQTADRQHVRRLIADMVRADEPTARNIRIVYEVPAGDGSVMTGRIPIPIDPAADDHKTAILTVLAKLKPGEWLGGKALAMQIDEELDHKGGAFTRAIAALKTTDPPKIESHKVHGYRLAARD